jgi:PD-(D/E)XK nuclease superfamily
VPFRLASLDLSAPIFQRERCLFALWKTEVLLTLPVMTYSFFNEFDNCPHKAFRRYVKRDLPFEEKSDAQLLGTRMHVALENLIGHGKVLPEEFRSAEPLAMIFVSMPDDFPVRVEYKLAMMLDGGGCAYDRKDAWFRGKLDVCAISLDHGAWIVDWKSGKVREDPFELECQALLLKASHPSVPLIQGEYYWFSEGRPGKRYTLTPDETYVKLAKKYEKVIQFNLSKNWPKTPNPLCGWCPVKDCEYNTNG